MMHKQKLFKIVFIWLGLIVATALLGKTTVASDNGTAAADFLNIGVGARAASMGGAFAAVAKDPTAAYWNPSGLALMEQPEVVLSHFSWYQDISYEYLAVAYPVNEKLTAGVGLSYLSYGSIAGYDQNDVPTGDLNSTYDLSFGLSVGYAVNDRLSLGLTGKIISLSLASEKASAIATDFGARYDLDRFSFGLTFANLGSSIKFINESEKLPALMRVGMSAQPFDGVTASLDIENQFHGNLYIRNGYEYMFEDRYFVRAGYAYSPTEEDRSFGQSPSFGVGAIFGPATFDYTFSPQEKFSSESIHRFSIQLML